MKKASKIKKSITKCAAIYSVCAVCFLLLTFFVIIPVCEGVICRVRVHSAFNELTEMNLSGLGDEDYNVLASYEAKSLFFTISDSEFNPVYISGDSPSTAIVRNIESHLDRFSEKYSITKFKLSTSYETLRIRMIVNQGGDSFYVFIRSTGFNEGTVAKTYTIMFILIVGLIVGECLMLHSISKSNNHDLEAIARYTKELSEDMLPEAIRSESFTPLEQGLYNDLLIVSAKLKDNQYQLLNQNLIWQKKENSRRNFYATASHSLKTPLAVISAEAELLELSGPEGNETAKSIREEIDKMRETISGLLDYELKKSEEFSFAPATVDFCNAVNNVVNKHTPVFKSKHLNISTEISDNMVVNGDEEYLEQAVTNFIMNAIEHTAIGGNIVVSLKPNGNMARLSVYNDGTPIPDDKLSKIWEGFHTYRNSESSTGHAGVGLFVVKNVANLHSGSCDVINKENGVEFIMEIPMK